MSSGSLVLSAAGRDKPWMLLRVVVPLLHMLLTLMLLVKALVLVLDMPLLLLDNNPFLPWWQYHRRPRVDIYVVREGVAGRQ